MYLICGTHWYKGQTPEDRAKEAGMARHFGSHDAYSDFVVRMLDVTCSPEVSPFLG